MVQSSFILKKLSLKFNIAEENILVLPFYKNLHSEVQKERIKDTFLYVSMGNPHKNHLKLIEGFCQFYDQEKRGKLILTVGEDFPTLLEVIKQKQKN